MICTAAARRCSQTVLVGEIPSTSYILNQRVHRAHAKILLVSNENRYLRFLALNWSFVELVLGSRSVPVSALICAMDLEGVPNLAHCHHKKTFAISRSLQIEAVSLNERLKDRS